MRHLNEVREALVRFFARRQIAILGDLFRVLQTRSPMTVFRKLSAVGYLTSYSHARRFYTLKDIPQFDASGLWQHRGVCFSRHGTLKETVARMVEEAEQGRFQRDLREQLHVRAHNTLHDLVRHRRIDRKPFAGKHLYVSTRRARATAQMARRKKQAARAAGRDAGRTGETADSSVVIAVLLEVIHAGHARASPVEIVRRLAARGVAITAEQVEGILRDHGVPKKGARSRSRPLRR